ncbi:probable 54S ribosomal protein L27, mitochondrial [Saccharomycodes ludwigii]|uniref:Probable 54S ribosomal protein L27, mitochondrial n=1 Tax=Saccharomycodes ludwigii TaxID=36035 RepID=A0A376B1P6_9ASCO|nr:hypothetical protein SCDLUD_003540 [Saccharomycodes ludwigii]KAH3900551.1 hypothetical protein SCDLUD_003540 [Saccharomycodes ludwigii]SSD58608.1 probable 54S ribosomal protein L27, mitochondrial [Saccharomycodes ludwigii]
MKPTPIAQLLRPWKKFRDGSLFYGLTKTGNKRVALTTKDGNKTMYKGTRSSGIGRHTKKGLYIINWNKVRTFVVPQVPNLQLKPLVSHKCPPLKQTFPSYKQGPMDTKFYYDRLLEYIKYGKVQSKSSEVDCYIEKF